MQDIYYAGEKMKKMLMILALLCTPALKGMDQLTEEQLWGEMQKYADGLKSALESLNEEREKEIKEAKLNSTNPIFKALCTKEIDKLEEVLKGFKDKKELAYYINQPDLLGRPHVLLACAPDLGEKFVILLIEYGAFLTLNKREEYINFDGKKKSITILDEVARVAPDMIQVLLENGAALSITENSLLIERIFLSTPAFVPVNDRLVKMALYFGNKPTDWLKENHPDYLINNYSIYDNEKMKDPKNYCDDKELQDFLTIRRKGLSKMGSHVFNINTIDYDYDLEFIYAQDSPKKRKYDVE